MGTHRQSSSSSSKTSVADTGRELLALKLPNAHLALIEQAKLCDYLLNAAHPDNGGEATFFQSLGFGRENWQALVAALRKLAGTADVSKSMESAHGRKYVVDGRIDSPGGKTSPVRTIWIVDLGAEAPRLVTAYPHEE